MTLKNVIKEYDIDKDHRYILICNGEYIGAFYEKKEAKEAILNEYYQAYNVNEKVQYYINEKFLLRDLYNDYVIIDREIEEPFSNITNE